MDRLSEILAILGDAAQLAALSADDLAALEGELRELFAAANADRSDETVEQAQQAAAGIGLIAAEQSRRDEEAARIAEEFDRLAAEIAPAADDTDDTADDVDETADETVDVPEVPALAAAAVQPTPLARVARRTARPAVRETGRVTATMRVAGRAVKSRREVVDALTRADAQIGQAAFGVQARIPIAQVTYDYPEERRLVNDPEVDNRRIDAVQGFAALAANSLTAGVGICNPMPVDYQMDVIADDSRPFRDSLPSYNATRGGVTVIPVPLLSGVIVDSAGGAITQQTAAEDAAGTDKTCQTVACPSSQSFNVYAMVRCLQFGNFQARYLPEDVDAWLTLTAAAWARAAEQRLIAALDAVSTPLTKGTQYGAIRDIPAAIAAHNRWFRQRHRWPASAAVHVWLPLWAIDMMVEDLANSLPHELGQMEFTPEDVLRIIRSRAPGVVVSTFIDAPTTTQEWSYDQSAGVENVYPATVVWYAAPEGKFFFLDGGNLDLGIVRDSTLNADNNFQLFAENFEGLAYRPGLPSYKVTQTVCASGASAGTVTAVCGS